MTASGSRRNTHNYLNTLLEPGRLPVVIVARTHRALPRRCRPMRPTPRARNADISQPPGGLILSGGGDVDPRYFGAEIKARRTPLTSSATNLSWTLPALRWTTTFPIFGICRGCQVLNVAAGGGMIQHFDGHRSPKTPRHSMMWS